MGMALALKFLNAVFKIISEKAQFRLMTFVTIRKVTGLYPIGVQYYSTTHPYRPLIVTLVAAAG